MWVLKKHLKDLHIVPTVDTVDEDFSSGLVSLFVGMEKPAVSKKRRKDDSE